MLTPNVHENGNTMHALLLVVMLIASIHGTTIVNNGLLFCRTKENVNTDWNKHDYQWEAIHITHYIGSPIYLLQVYYTCAIHTHTYTHTSLRSMRFTCSINQFVLYFVTVHQNWTLTWFYHLRKLYMRIKCLIWSYRKGLWEFRNITTYKHV